MNKYLNAINEISAALSYSNYGDEDLLAIDLYTIRELVDKATPKKPTNQKYDNVNDVGSGICICDSRVYEYHMFCPYCGQAIDWSKDEK